MKKQKDLLLLLIICIFGFGMAVFSSEVEGVSFVDYRVLLDGEFIDKALDDPLLSYNDKTYVSIRDVAKHFNKDVKWTENTELITLSQKKPEKLFITNEETVLTVAKALIKEHFPDKVGTNTLYAISEISNEMVGGDTEFNVFVVFDGGSHTEEEIEYIFDNADVNITLYQKAWKITMESLK